MSSLHAQPRNSLNVFAALKVGLLTALMMFCSVGAAQEFELRGSDLRVIGDLTWTGGGWGGYHPIRFEITNFGPGRDIELRFQPHERGRGTPTVRKRMRVEQNATARVTLAVPLVGGHNSGQISVLIEGAETSGLSRDVTLASPAEGEFPQPALLIISPEKVSPRGFDEAIAAATHQVTDTGFPSSHFAARSMGLGASRVATVDPSMLPGSWIDFTAVDLVAIPLDLLSKLDTETRTALFDWVATGGRLIVDRAGPAPTDSDQLRKLLEPLASDRSTFEWKPADTAVRREIPVVVERMPGGRTMIPNEGNPLPLPLPFPTDALPGGLKQHELMGLIEGAIGETPAGWSRSPTWSSEEPPFFMQRIAFGRIAVVEGDVIAANGADWTWLLNELGGAAMVWPVRQGLLSGRGDIEFINQPIPGVRGIPTAAFLILITLFALLIGPVNYIWLWRKKQLSRLVVTVPALAIVTSILLFGYAAISHGFSTKGRVRSVTWLDPSTNSATSFSRIALFAGMAPSSGLAFSNQTAVFPLYPFQQEFIDGDVDWTEMQQLTGGWFKSRTRTQFVTLNRRDERGRLTVDAQKGGLRVVNGLSVPLTYLIVTDKKGQAFLAENLPAGGETVAELVTDEQWGLIREFALDRIPEPPDGLDPKEITDGLWGDLPWRWHERVWKPRFREGLLERHLARLIGQAPGSTATSQPPAEESENEYANATSATGDLRVDLAVGEDTFDPLARPRHFLAVAVENPGIDLAGLEVDERESLHMIMGSW